MKRGNGLRYAKAYTKIIRDPRLTPLEKALYVCLKSYCNVDGLCIPSVPLICQNLNINRKTFHRAMKRLEEFGIVHRQPRAERGNQTSNFYLFNDEHFAKHCAKYPSPKNGPPCQPQKRATSKTYIEEQPLNVIPIQQAS